MVGQRGVIEKDKGDTFSLSATKYTLIMSYTLSCMHTQAEQIYPTIPMSVCVKYDSLTGNFWLKSKESNSFILTETISDTYNSFGWHYTQTKCETMSAVSFNTESDTWEHQSIADYFSLSPSRTLADARTHTSTNTARLCLDNLAGQPLCRFQMSFYIHPSRSPCNPNSI